MTAAVPSSLCGATDTHSALPRLTPATVASIESTVGGGLGCPAAEPLRARLSRTWPQGALAA